MLNTEMVTKAPMFANLLVGIIGVFIVMYTNVFFGRRVALYYEIQARIRLSQKRFNGVINQFFLAVIFLALIQVSAILFWAGCLLLLNLVPSFSDAVLFAGSCYTTLGFINDILPFGWRFLALFIALSGLFSVAISTATMLNMMPLFRNAWLNKHSAHIKEILIRHNITITGIEEIDTTIDIKTKKC